MRPSWSDGPTVSLPWPNAAPVLCNQAITAMTIADMVGGRGVPRADDAIWLHLDGWAAELGLTAPAAVAWVSQLPAERQPEARRPQPAPAARRPGQAASGFRALARRPGAAAGRSLPRCCPASRPRSRPGPHRPARPAAWSRCRREAAPALRLPGRSCPGARPVRSACQPGVPAGGLLRDGAAHRHRLQVLADRPTWDVGGSLVSCAGHRRWMPASQEAVICS
jgi:hypothetical protein